MGLYPSDDADLSRLRHAGLADSLRINERPGAPGAATIVVKTVNVDQDGKAVAYPAIGPAWVPCVILALSGGGTPGDDVIFAVPSARPIPVACVADGIPAVGAEGIIAHQVEGDWVMAY